MSNMRDRRVNVSVINTPANQVSKASGLDGVVVQTGVQNVPADVQTCDGMWADQISKGDYENFNGFLIRNCLHDKKFVDDKGKVYPPGSLKYPISNQTLSRSVYIYPQSPYPSQIPLMSHGMNSSVLAQARANAIRNNGNLQSNATMFDQAKRSVKNVLARTGI